MSTDLDLDVGAPAAVRPEDFRHRAACRSGVDPELFFPTAQTGALYKRQVAAAKAVCAGCPVRTDCLAWALAALPYGIAGGLTEQERRRQRNGANRRPRIRRPPAGRRAGATPSELAAAGRAAIASGASPRRAAVEFGVSERTAQRWAQALNCNTSPAAGRGAPAATGLPSGSPSSTTPRQGHEPWKDTDPR